MCSHAQEEAQPNLGQVHLAHLERRTRPAGQTLGRYRSLDGLRGVAAVVVVLHHAFLTVPVLASAYYPRTGHIAIGSGAWLLTYTPAHLIWAGSEAVFLFFILSGIVLTLPVLRSPRFCWLAYYPRRVIRLYGPVVVAAVFGLLTILLVARFDDPALGGWMNARPNVYSAESIGRDATLVFGASGVISPFWSLRWEVLFSLALPLYVWATQALARTAWVSFLLVCAFLVWGSVQQGQHSYYLPMFAIGTVMVTHWERVTRLAAAIGRCRRGWLLLSVAAVLLTCARWELIGLGMNESAAKSYSWVSVIGVTLLVLAAAFCRPLKQFLEAPLAQWLGAVSFSLYLVHEPIIIAVRFLTVHLPPGAGIAISLPIAFTVAALFVRLVEQPFHQLSRRVGRRVEIWQG